MELATLTSQESWVAELRTIPEELRVDESALWQSRWFDYRDLLPGQATILFSQRYIEVFKDFFARMRDKNQA